MVKRWHVPPVIGRIRSGVPSVEVVAAADYDALAAKAAEHRDGRLVALERIRELEAEVHDWRMTVVSVGANVEANVSGSFAECHAQIVRAVNNIRDQRDRLEAALRRANAVMDLMK